MTAPRPLFALALLASVACVTTPEPAPVPAPVATEAPPPPPKPTLPIAVQVVPSRLDPSSALNRALERASAGGFKFRLPDYLEPGRDAPLEGLDVQARALAASDIAGAFDGTLAKALCRRRVEVLYVGSTPGKPASFLRMSCHTEVLEWDGVACRRHAEIGCPDGGDRVVGELALDAAGSI